MTPVKWYMKWHMCACFAFSCCSGPKVIIYILRVSNVNCLIYFLFISSRESASRRRRFSFKTNTHGEGKQFQMLQFQFGNGYLCKASILWRMTWIISFHIRWGVLTAFTLPNFKVQLYNRSNDTMRSHLMR